MLTGHVLLLLTELPLHEAHGAEVGERGPRRQRGCRTLLLLLLLLRVAAAAGQRAQHWGVRGGPAP